MELIADADSLTLSGATVTITSGLQAGDRLILGSGARPHDTGLDDTETGTLTITGEGTAAQLQEALRVVLGSPQSGDAQTPTKTISFTVTDGTLTSTPATKTITLTDCAESDLAPPQGRRAARRWLLHRRR